jgi:hypothetical protein
MEEAMPSEKGDVLDDEPMAPATIYLDVGTKGIFKSYTNDFLQQYEYEAGIKEPIMREKPIIIELKEEQE